MTEQVETVVNTQDDTVEQSNPTEDSEMTSAAATSDATPSEAITASATTDDVTAENVATGDIAAENATEEGITAESAVAEPTAEVETSDTVSTQPEASDAPAADGSTADIAEPVAQNDTVSSGDTSNDDASSDEASEGDTSGDEASDDGDGPVVKLLSVGQKVPGVVRRITDFGAFVDIGVGRDGLIHVSELSVRRVGKVTDVLQENQEVEVWIKKLDRERNRISLTMIEPGTKTIRDLEKDEIVKGTVTRILPYGAFIDIGIGRDALLHIREMSEGFVARPEDVVSVGEELEARVIELSRRRQRVDLSIKGLRPEPEVELPPEAEAEAEAATSAQAEDEVVDEFADVEVLSPMELAFKRAMEAEGIEIDTSSTARGSKKKRKKGKRGRSIQDEIIARTLEVANNQ